jgi:hypothetical protein
MAITKDADKDPVSAGNDVKLLLGEFMLILDNRERVSSPHNCIPIYVHENLYAFNVCKIGAGATCENDKNA